MDPKQLLDVAFRQARKEAGVTKGKRSVAKERRHVEADLRRVLVAHSAVAGRLREYMKMSEIHVGSFERELLATAVNFDQLAKDAKKIENSLKIIDRLRKEFEVKIKYADNKTESHRYQTAFYGRMCSVVKKLKFNEIEKLEKEKKKLPRIKKMKTVIICGYPNVGKSLIIKNLTGHKIEIASYPFTTKGIMIGFLKKDYDEIQMIDTPGLLDRPLQKMNAIEKKAALALKYLSKNILFVMDPSEDCGYSLESQNNLLHTVRKEFSPKMLVVSTHADLPQREFQADLNINSKEPADIKRLKEKIFEFFV
jgi:nucleolar GTP-binding protein